MQDMFRHWILGLILVVGCSGGTETGGGAAGGSGTAALDTARACSNLIEYCPDGYSWSEYISDEAGCRRIFSCTYELYSGNCRKMVGDATACLAALTDASECLDCNDIILPTQTECDRPSSCL